MSMSFDKNVAAMRKAGVDPDAMDEAKAIQKLTFRPTPGGVLAVATRGRASDRKNLRSLLLITEALVTHVHLPVDVDSLDTREATARVAAERVLTLARRAAQRRVTGIL